MTKEEMMIRILYEVSGKPKEYLSQIVDGFKMVYPSTKVDFEQEFLPDTEVPFFLNALPKEALLGLVQAVIEEHQKRQK